MLLKILEIWALVPLILVLRPGVWLELSVLASQLSTSDNCSLVFSLQQGLDCERVEDVSLLAILLLVIELVEAFS